LIFEVNIANN